MEEEIRNKLDMVPEKNYEYGIARFFWDDRVVGAGFCIQGKYLITCAHVVSECFGICADIPPENPPGLIVKVDFPFANTQKLDAKISLWLHKNDIACLEIQDAMPVQVNPVVMKPSSTDQYLNHPFYVFGFPEGYEKTGIPSRGKLERKIAEKEWISMQTDFPGYEILPGFSGSPVWDLELNGVVGMTVARDGENTEARKGFMIPYEKLKPVLQAIELFDILLPEESVLEQHWRNAYRLASSRSDDLHTLQEAILKIQDVPPQLGEPSLPIEQFAAYFALVKFDFNVKDRIKEWLKTQVEDVNTLLKYVAEKVEQKESASSNPHLIIWLDREESSDENDEKYRLEAYLILDRNSYDASNAFGIEFLNDHNSFLEDGKIGKSKLEELLPKCLQEAIDEALGYLPDPDPDKSQIEMQIEIFLPRQFLHLPIDCWDAEEVIGDVFASNPIGHSYRFVLRVIDRLRTINKNSIHNRWKEKWKISQQQTTLELIWWDFQDPISQFKFLAFSGGAIGWFRLQPTQFNSENNSCPFSALVGAGAPIAIWLRQESPNFASEFFKYFGVVAEKPGETPTKIPYAKNLPEKVRQLRRAASDRDDKTIPHIGEHIGLIWEDPKLIPPSFGQPSKEKRLRMAN